MKIIKKTVSILLRIGISIALLVFLFKQADEKLMFETVKRADKHLLFLAFAILSANYVLCLYRWQMLLKAADVHLSLKRTIIAFSGGIFFSLFLPSSIGGDFVRSIDLAAYTKKPRQVVASVLLDRLSGYVGLVILTLIAVCIGWDLIHDNSVVISVCILTALLVVILLVLFNKFIYSKIHWLLRPSGSDYSAEEGRRLPVLDKILVSLQNLHREIHYFRQHKKIIFNNLALSAIVQATTPVSFYFISMALGLKIKLIYFFIFLPIIGAVTLLPISIGGLGLRDAMTIFFFAKIGVAKDMSFAMSLLSFVFLLVYGGIGGIIYVLTVRHRRLQYGQPSPVGESP